jgi:proline racemase
MSSRTFSGFEMLDETDPFPEGFTVGDIWA